MRAAAILLLCVAAVLPAHGEGTVGNAAYAAGDYATAYEQWLVRAEEGSAQAQFNLGRLYGQMGDPGRQREMWEAAITSNPDFARGYYYLAKLLMDRDDDLGRAEELARRGIDKDPEGHAGPLGYFVLADLLNRTGRPAQAQEALEKGRAIQID